MAINLVCCGLSTFFWSLLLLVNTHGNFYCKQGMLLETRKVVYMENKVAYRKHHFTTSWYVKQSTTSCQYIY